MRSNEAYSSFEDLRCDLQLMIDDPPWFLKNIETCPLPPLLICDKLYGREDELKDLEQSFVQHCMGECSGVIIKGKAGVGKSKLAMHVQELSRKLNGGCFLVAKFDQSQNVQPLATVGSLLDSLCDIFFEDATVAQLKVVEEALETALGVQSSLLFEILPNLVKLMPSCARPGYLGSCIYSGLSMSFLFSELLRIISSHSRHISFFLDDMHWADPLSLVLVGGLISNGSVFFTCSYRDDEVDEDGHFNQWLSSISRLSIKTIKIENLTMNGVNSLISDALHLSTRITQPLSSVLHHKAGGGNPLFVTRLLESLKEKGHISVDLSYPKWDWDLDNIMDLEISDDVVTLLVDDMKKLHPDLQLGLKTISCVGSRVTHSVLNILSQDLGENLHDILHRVSEKGFMNNVGGTMFSFSHDKIQQAAYEMMPEQQRRENHMRFGLAICSNALSVGNEELFFTAVNQINLGGPSVLSKSSQRTMVASLNLKAGKRCSDLSDLNTALTFFKKGISFLDDNHWHTDYVLSINLYDALSDAACTMNDGAAVTFYTKQLIVNARCVDDKLNCMFAIAKTVSNMGLEHDAIDSIFSILLQLGESLPRPMGDPSLLSDVYTMNTVLRSMTDEMILNKEDAVNKKKYTTLMKVYRVLGHAFHFFKPALFGATGLRMMELTLSNGIDPTSPVSFAYYGEFLASIGNLDLAVRLGGLALKISEKKGFLRTKPQIIPVVYQSIFWSSIPFQSIVDAHFSGYKAAQQSGDFMASSTNYAMFLTSGCYNSGQSLDEIRENCRELVLRAMHKNEIGSFIADLCCHLHSQICVLMTGQHLQDSRHIDDVPCPKDMFCKTEGPKKANQATADHIHWLTRTLLFRQFENLSGVCLLSGMLAQKKIPFLRSIILFGIFLEGLLSYQLARQANDEEESLLWAAKGDSILSKMQIWNDHCSWNFENKMLLMKAERMAILGEHDTAASLYTKSIRSAHDHKFIHEQAIASELAGFFYYQRGLHAKSYSFFMHSVECYNKWGAFAVTRRVESNIQSQFDSSLLLGLIDESLASTFTSDEGSSKKRQIPAIEP